MAKGKEKFMRLALYESHKAMPNCLPNPPVGCVLVKGGKVISSGYTREPGCFHAEADALSKISEELCEVEAYVTLEPCSFVGRTPSCANTLVERGISAIYIALIDPHPKNRGKGIDILKDAGIPVHVGLCMTEVELFIRPFLINE